MKLTLTDPANLQNEASAVATIASNNTLIENAIENTLSLDGTSPNALTADLDINSNRIINLPAASTDTEPVRKAEFDAGVAVLGAGAFTGMTVHGVLTASTTAIATSTAEMSDGQVLVGRTGLAPLPRTMSGDATITSTGVITVATVNGTALGTASLKNTGTSGNTVPLLDGANTFSANQAITGTLSVSGNVAVNTNKFTVAASSGNTVVAGTLGVTGVTTLTGVALGADGTKTAPGYSFSGDTDSGLYRISTNNLGISCGDTKIMDILTTGVNFTGQINATGAIKSSSPTGGIGYVTGAGGTVTQATNKSTGVTLNAPVGAITMNAAALGATTSVAFTLTNVAIAAADVVIVNIKSGATANSYFASVDSVTGGACNISLRNYTAGSLAEAVVLNFAVIRGVTS